MKIFSTLAPRPRILVIACAGLLAACGAQGPPRPPRIEKPERITDLEVAQVGRTLTLSFTPPEDAADGERLTKPVSIEIFRALKAPGSSSGASPATAGGGAPWRALAPADVARHKQDEKAVVAETLSDQDFRQLAGSTFEFAVRGSTRGFRGRPIEGDLSKAVEIKLLDVSAAIQGLTGRTEEHAIVLNWTPPSQSLTGAALAGLAGYRVYKSANGKPDSFILLPEASGPTHEDHDFIFEKTYYYRVRALFRSGGQTAESEDSLPFVVSPRDVFPPAAPAGLTALYSAGAVDLIWSASTEPDLAGYNVYRREVTGGAEAGTPAPSLKLNKNLVDTPIFRDTAVEARHRYSYRVTAVDLAGNESLPSPEAEVESEAE